MKFQFLISGILFMSLFGMAFGTIEEMEDYLPDEEDLNQSWHLSEIQSQEDVEVPGSDETVDAVIRQYAIQNNEQESVMLVTLNIYEFSSTLVANQMLDINYDKVFENDVNAIDVTMPGDPNCFGAVANLDMENEASIVSCQSDEFVVICQSTQSEDVYEENIKVSTSRVSATFANFVVQSILDDFQNEVPYWLKNTAKWWSEGILTDTEFLDAIEFLIKEDIISVSKTPTPAITTVQIPTWIKTNAGWWADGNISDQEFVKSIEYLINNGVITI